MTPEIAVGLKETETIQDNESISKIIEETIAEKLGIPVSYFYVKNKAYDYSRPRQLSVVFHSMFTNMLKDEIINKYSLSHAMYYHAIRTVKNDARDKEFMARFKNIETCISEKLIKSDLFFKYIRPW
jgi:chromosomal replication initiation ATPase DnaA